MYCYKLLPDASLEERLTENGKVLFHWPRSKSCLVLFTKKLVVSRETLVIPKTQIFDLHEQKLWLEPVKVLCFLCFGRQQLFQSVTV